MLPFHSKSASANNYENTIRSLELIFNNILAAKTYYYFAFYTHLQFGKLDPLGGEGGGWGLRFVPVRPRSQVFYPPKALWLAEPLAPTAENAECIGRNKKISAQKVRAEGTKMS